MGRIKCVLLTVIVAVLVFGCGKNPAKQGVEYLEDGEYKKAIEQFEEAIEKEKNVGDAYRGIGIAKWEMEDYEGACEAFKNALENDAKKRARSITSLEAVN